MMNSEKERMARWVNTWKRAGHALRAVKRKELREYDYFKHQGIVDEMLQWAYNHRKVRSMSGMVEMQRYFMKMKDRRPQGK